MEFRAWTFVGVILAAGCASTGGGGDPPAHTPEEEMAAWMKAGTPGDPHKRLAQEVGEWAVTWKTWMAPDAPPTESTGKSSIRSIMEGRFTMQDVDGSFMGMPFKGMGVSGYDNLRGKYVAAWWDSMGTAILHMEGDADAMGVITMKGSMLDPFGKKCTMTAISRMEGKDRFVFEMFGPPPGAPEGSPEVKMMELDYRRAK